MKFLYEYRTPDNAKHNGVICASDREAAYAALKKQGIKPSRFSEAPGLFNKLFGKGKRWMAIGVLAVAATVSTFLAFSRGGSASTVGVDEMLDSMMRRQVIGDALVVEKGIKTGWADVFALEGERFLASYAIPGAAPAVRATSEEEIRKALDHDCRKTENSVGKNSSLITHHSSLEPASLEARQVRAMVEGMKQELRDYLADGGTIAKYGRRIVRRQQEEIGYYNRVKNEIENATKAKMTDAALEELWEQRNTVLRKLGIRPVSLAD